MGQTVLFLVLLSLQLLSTCSSRIVRASSVASTSIEPYPYLNDGSFSGPSVPQSPDPLVQYRWATTVNSSLLQVFNTVAVNVSSNADDAFEGLASLTSGLSNVTVVGNGDVLLDFGQENAAWIEMDSPDLVLNESATVTLTVSEVNQPETILAHAKTGVPVKYGHTFRLETNAQLYEGVRYGMLHVRNLTRPFRITAIRAVCQIKPTNYSATFASADPMITRIWYTAAYTVKLNLLASTFGAILMDRGDRIAWVGDEHVAQGCALVAFKDYDFVHQNLVMTANETNGGIESYSIYWVMSAVDFLKYTGDVKTFVSLLPYIESKLQHGLKVYGNATLRFFGWDDRLGSGFANASCQESQYDYMMLVIRACREVAWGLQQANMTVLAAKYEAYAQARWRELTTQQPQWFRVFGMHAAADAVNTGLVSVEEANAINTLHFNDVVQICSFSPFNMFWILQALGNINATDKALYALKRCWGGQVQLGGTTFWEVYSPEWNALLGVGDPIPQGDNGATSLCHPWSAGPTKWLTEHHLGVRPLSAGFRHTLIAPHIGSQTFFVSGDAATPHGTLSVTLDYRGADSGVLFLRVPAGVELLELHLPLAAGARHVTAVAHNGRLVYAHGRCAQPATTARCTPRATSSVLVLCVVSPAANHKFATKFGARPELNTSFHSILSRGASPFPPPRYNATVLPRDTFTQGNWRGVYGLDGYALLSWQAVGQPALKLPSYVSNVTRTFARAQTGQWALATPDDVRALQDPSGGTQRRIGWWAQTMTFAMDITLSAREPRPFQLSVYMVDYDLNDRSQVVDFFELPSLNRVAPTQHVTKFGSGVYLSYTFDRSCRLRFSNIRPTNSVASAVFFDPVPSGA